jgi:hypothetical protein
MAEVEKHGPEKGKNCTDCEYLDCMDIVAFIISNEGSCRE